LKAAARAWRQFSQKVELAISERRCITETSRILRHKFCWKPEDVTDAVEQILRFMKYVHPDYTLDVVPADPDDKRALCALNAGPPTASLAFLGTRFRAVTKGVPLRTANSNVS
jgi:hypothetical protein